MAFGRLRAALRPQFVQRTLQPSYLGQVTDGKRRQLAAAHSSEPQTDQAPVPRVMPGLHETSHDRAFYELNGAVMANEQLSSDVGDRRPALGWGATYGEQQLMLSWGKAGLTGQRVTLPQEAASRWCGTPTDAGNPRHSVPPHRPPNSPLPPSASPPEAPRANLTSNYIVLRWRLYKSRKGQGESSLRLGPTQPTCPTADIAEPFGSWLTRPWRAKGGSRCGRGGGIRDSPIRWVRWLMSRRFCLVGASSASGPVTKRCLRGPG